MSYAASQPLVDARTSLEAFVRRARAELEDRLVEECEELGSGLSGFTEVLASGIGTDGRGGGRWRPLLTLGAAEACGGELQDAMDAAVAIELTHTASLMLDDLPCMDDSPTRRGQPATHQLAGSAGAILLSVGLLSRSAELLGRGRATASLAGQWGKVVGLQGMAGGQAIDVSMMTPLLGAPRRLHRQKSSALPAFALAAGARMAGASQPTVDTLEAFGRALGWAYQLLDDAQDYEEDSKLGRALTGARPRERSERIMRLAVLRLEKTAEIDEAGRELVLGIAHSVLDASPRLRTLSSATKEG